MAFGIASVTHALEGVHFPKTKNELIKEYGNKEIEFRMGQKECLKEILQKIPEEKFNSMADVTHAVHELYT